MREDFEERVLPLVDAAPRAAPGRGASPWRASWPLRRWSRPAPLAWTPTMVGAISTCWHAPQLLHARLVACHGGVD